MTDLDRRLTDIANQLYEHDTDSIPGPARAVELMREAIEQSGYVQSSEIGLQKWKAENGYMSGQEWFDKYIDYLETLGLDGYTLVGRSAWIAKEAARRAAGIEEPETHDQQQMRAYTQKVGFVDSPAPKKCGRPPKNRGTK